MLQRELRGCGLCVGVRAHGPMCGRGCVSGCVRPCIRACGWWDEVGFVGHSPSHEK